LSALSLTVFLPCILGGQNPAPPSPMAVHRDAMAGPIEQRMLVRAVAGRNMMHDMMMTDAASMFLGAAGQLQLSDSQVTRLATIARRSASRREAMKARMDSAMMAAHARVGSAMHDGADGGAMMMMMMSMPMLSSADRAAQHTDDRDAFAILTPDQLATAWELMASHHPLGGM
jgi:hypothetical protein